LLLRAVKEYMPILQKAQRLSTPLMVVGGGLLCIGIYCWVQFSLRLFLWIGITGWGIAMAGALFHVYRIFFGRLTIKDQA
jgi:hypothetical protein